MAKWTSRVAWLVVVACVLLAPPPAGAQILECPMEGPECLPTGTWCSGWTIEWLEDYCGCEGDKRYWVDCYGPTTTGHWCGDVPGCLVSNCLGAETQRPCDPRLEETGTPPQPSSGGGGSPPGNPPCPNGPCPPGQPVSVTTGEMYFSHNDAVVGELSLTRTYNTARLTPTLRFGAFGPGWNTSFEIRINAFSAKLLELRLPDGTPVYYFDGDEDGAYEMDIPRGKGSWIETLPDGYRRVFRYGGFETYDASGGAVSTTDAAGVVTMYTRDAQGRLASVSRHGRGISFTYAGSATRPAQLEAPDGSVLASYSYDPATGWLAAVDYPDGSGYRYGYDVVGRIVWIRDAAGLPVEFHAYDGAGRAVTSEIGDGQERLTFSYGTNQTTVTDALGNAAVYDWEPIAHVPQVTKVTGWCQGCAGAGESQEWTYDEAGNVTSRTDGLQNTWTYTYDENGDLIEETDPLDQVTSYTYDGQGRMLTRTGHDGSLTTYTWDAAGPASVTEKLSETESRTTSYVYDAGGRPTSITDPRNETTTLAYDGLGDLASVTDPLEHVTSFGYDALGRRTTVTDALDHTTTTSYDPRGRVSRITNHDGSFTEFSYDRSGRRTGVTDPLGRTTYYLYDAYGRLEKVVDPLNGETTYSYDLKSNLVSLTDAEGNTTSFAYDAFGRVTTVTYPGGAEESFTYDLAGRLETKTDRKGVITTYTYDILGRLTGKSYTDGTPAVSYTYDAGGRLATAANGTDSLSWTYDLAGQLLSETSTKNASTVAYTYDLAGNRLSVSLDGAVFVTYGYDDASRLTTITRGSNVFGFGYDEVNRRTTMTYPNGVTTSYSYDDLSRLLNLQAVHVPTSTQITSFTYTYDAAGNRTSKTQLDYAESYEYDRLYRLRGVERTGAGSGRQRFGYDAVGNRTVLQVNDDVYSAAHNERNQLLSTTAGGRLRWRGSLDEPGQVAFTSATVNGQPARMLAGNVFEADLEMAPGTNTVTLEATDASGNVRTQTYEADVAGSGATYDYDANGNLTEKVEAGETWTYEWNAENQLIRVTKDGGEVATFAYDPRGRRVEKAAGGVTTSWTYDGKDNLRETQAGGTVFKYIHGPGMDEPLARQDADTGALTYYHADGLGSITKMTDQAGSVVHSYRYDGWGGIEVGASQAGYAFTGREWDPETGLHYYRNRYYEPSQGRFISEDPIGFSGGINFFEYASSNPIALVDPFGLLVEVHCVPIGMGGNDLGRRAAGLFFKHCYIRIKCDCGGAAAAPYDLRLEIIEEDEENRGRAVIPPAQAFGGGGTSSAQVIPPDNDSNYCEHEECLRRMYQSIQRRGRSYNFINNNSNTFVEQLLNACGMTVVFPPGVVG